MTLCKTCKKIPIIEFLDFMNLSIECHKKINIKLKEFEREYLCVIKKDETNSIV